MKLFNSLTQQKQAFIPIDPTHIKLYACGPTVYNYAHIGNARMAVVFDQLSRILRYHYPKVTYVSNITDIDDKIINAAREQKEDIYSLTQRYTAIYNADMAQLGVNTPDIQPKATEHIPDMISLIESLIQKDHAYVAEHHVLFHVPSYPKYGVLSKRDAESQRAGSRVEVAPYKKDATDFVLWKPSTADQPGWESPWGFGRPGWHIECSAMLERYLGLPADIHGGGQDLLFPHHENELAQSCCAHDNANHPESFASYWVHNGFVTIADEKMSKSIGNIKLVHDLIQHYPGEVLRLSLLSSHYRQPLNWTTDLLTQQQTALNKWYRSLYDTRQIDVTVSETDIPRTVIDALSDDLNTAKAIACLHELSTQLNQATTRDAKKQVKTKLLASARLLGLLQQDPEQWLGFKSTQNNQDETSRIEAIIEKRNQARKTKDFQTSDKLRDELKQQGIELEDTPEGTTWRYS